MTTSASRTVGELLLVTGMSGAGRSVTAGHLADLGWTVIDNLPEELVPDLVELTASPTSTIGGTAVAVNVGVGRAQLLLMNRLRSSAARMHTLYLDASTETLLRRYGATRRRHPFAVDIGTEHLVTAIEHERELLVPVRADADVVVDTTDFNFHQLRSRIAELVSDEAGDGMRVTLLSFGYKHGLPLDTDMVLDCRFLPNPHWVEDLRPSTGTDAAVRDYLLQQPPAETFLGSLDAMLADLLPAFQAEHKSYLTIALGCTGGRHRSVTMTEQLAVRLRRRGMAPTVAHRDVDK